MFNVTRASARLALLATAVFVAVGAAGPSRKERLAALPEGDRIWLTEFVAPIILPEEDKVFLELASPHERERFKREFWARRERDGLPYPLGPAYESRYAELRRRADEAYDGWREDAGRMVLRYGEPGDVRKVMYCDHVFRDLEVWTLRNTAISPGTIHLLFYRVQPLVPRKLWGVGARDSDVFLPNSCRQRFPELWVDCPEAPIPLKLADKCKGPVCLEACDVFHVVEEILSRHHNASGAFQERTTLLAPQLVSLEGIDRIKDVSATASNPQAKPLSVTGPSATVVKTSKKDRLDTLPDEERGWLTEFVAPIIRPEEETLFLELTEGYQREIFKKSFWERREKEGLAPPFGPGFARRYEELRRRLDSEYDGWRNDAGRMVLHYGEPSDIHHVEGCDKVFRDLEIWTYVNLVWVRQTVHHLFSRAQPTAPRKLWRADHARPDSRATGKPCQGTPRSDDVFVPGACRRNFESLVCDCSQVQNDPCKGPVCGEACEVYRVYQEILARQGNPLGGFVETGRLLALPDVSTEGLEQLRKTFATTADPNARAIRAEAPSSRSSRPPDPAPTPEPRRSLSVEEMRDRIVHLEPKYRQWLDLAGPLLTLDELSLFLQLPPREKDRFVKAFWKKRS